MRIDLVGTKRDGCESIARIASQAGYGKWSQLFYLLLALGRKN